MNLMIVFLLSGLWHGANWTFLVWGAIHGAALAASAFTAGIRQQIRTVVASSIGAVWIGLWQRLCVGAVVTLGWLFFRATSLDHARTLLRQLGNGWGALAHPGSAMHLIWDAGYGRLDLILCAGLIATVFAMEWFERRRAVNAWICSLPAWQRWGLYHAFVIALFALAPGSGDQFIYFQF
jgi:hypothetical protein